MYTAKVERRYQFKVLDIYFSFLQKGKLWEPCKLGDSGAVEKLFANMNYIDVAPMKVNKKDIFDIVASIHFPSRRQALLDQVKLSEMRICYQDHWLYL